MKNLIELIAKHLVSLPEQVNVSEKKEGDTIYIELNVAPEDMGKVIGKQGRIAKAIRNIAKANALMNGQKVVLDIK